MNPFIFNFIAGIGAGEWLVILLVVVLLFGGKKIPELFRGIGQGIREFNNAKNTVENEIREGMKDKPTRSSDVD